MLTREEEFRVPSHLLEEFTAYVETYLKTQRTNLPIIRKQDMYATYEEATREDLLEEVKRLVALSNENAALSKSHMDADGLINTRAATHGSYHHQAALAASLKRFLRAEPHYDKLLLQHQEALDMIMTKISRIIWGNPNHRDHWDDIAGYATLASRECLKP